MEINMKIVEERREIPVWEQVDVLVVGSGPAGVSAAVCAAREGVSVMLLEQTGNVGGIATEGLMSHWTGNTEGGFYDEILERSADAGRDDAQMRKVINPERLKIRVLGKTPSLYFCLCAGDGRK